VNHKLTTLISGLLVVLLSAFAGAATLDEEIRERLNPAGSVCVFGDDCAAGMAVAGSAGPRDAETIYNTYCMVCHATGVSEAPIFGNAEQWEPRLAKGMDVLYASGINGLAPGMPARGMCFDCSDDDIRAVVDYMTASVQ